MISGGTMKSIAQLTRDIGDPKLKQYMVDNWEVLRKLQKTKSEKWSDKLIDALCDESRTKVKALLHLRG